MKNAHRYSCLTLALLASACGGGQSFDDGRDGLDPKVTRPSEDDDTDEGPAGKSDGGVNGADDDADADDTDTDSDDTDSAEDDDADDRDGADDDADDSDTDDDTDDGAEDDTDDEGPNGTPSGVNPGNPDAPQFSCDEVSSQQFDSATMRPYSVSREVEDAVESTLQSMDAAQLATQLMGVDGSTRNYRDIERAPDVEVPGVGVVRGLHFREGGHGVNLESGQDNRPDDGRNYATVFPSTSLRGASWDLELERRIGAASGDETAASLNNVLVAPSADLLRHPYWGRSQESYGEDPYFVGRMATAFTVGAQQFVLACAKNFAAYGVELRRSSVDMQLTEQALREIYTRQFEMVVQDGGVGCLMAGYNLVNGVKATQNRHLLEDVLRTPVADGGMGFAGIVITELWAMPGDQNVPDAALAQTVANEALLAGTDVERPWTQYYTTQTLANADANLVERSARRVLTQKYRFGSALASDPFSLQPPTSTLTEGSITPNETHEALAEEAALESAVLLVNGLDQSDPVLPLDLATNIAVIGLERDFRQVSSTVPPSCSAAASNSPRECTFHFATDPALGDRGSTLVNGDPARSYGPFQGLQMVAGEGRTVTSGTSAEAAADADAVVVVVGYTPGDEGEEYYIAEGGDRPSLELPAGQADLVLSVLDLDKPTVIVIESGSVVNVPWLAHPNQKQATVWAGYPGQRGGIALGKLLLGEANFSGKLPFSWPVETELPPFRGDTSVTLDYFFGYREYDHRQNVEGTPVSLVFPFGHGLSYASYSYSNLAVPCDVVTQDAVIDVLVDIDNTSAIDGEEVAMLFVKPPAPPAGTTGERPWKELKSFARVAVPAGQRVTAHLPLRVRDLRRWEGGEDGAWVIDSGEYTLSVGKNAADAETSDLQGILRVEGTR